MGSGRGRQRQFRWIYFDGGYTLLFVLIATTRPSSSGVGLFWLERRTVETEGGNIKGNYSKEEVGERAKSKFLIDGGAMGEQQLSKNRRPEKNEQ